MKTFKELKEDIYHKWEQIPTVGKPPYKLVNLIEMPPANLLSQNPSGYNNWMRESQQIAKGYHVHIGSCYVCGTGIRYNYVCQNGDKNFFVVGSECVKKSGDSKLMTAVEKQAKELERTKKEEKRFAEQEKKRLEYEQNIAAQRQRNGGLTDYELAQKKRDEEREKHITDVAMKNSWLLEILRKASGNFVFDMIRLLAHEGHLARDLSPGQIRVLKDIYSKYTGSKKPGPEYDKAGREFEDKLRE